MEKIRRFKLVKYDKDVIVYLKVWFCCSSILVWWAWANLPNENNFLQAEKWRAPVITPLDVDVFHDKACPHEGSMMINFQNRMSKAKVLMRIHSVALRGSYLASLTFVWYIWYLSFAYHYDFFELCLVNHSFIPVSNIHIMRLTNPISQTHMTKTTTQHGKETVPISMAQG